MNPNYSFALRMVVSQLLAPLNHDTQRIWNEIINSEDFYESANEMEDPDPESVVKNLTEPLEP